MSNTKDKVLRIETTANIKYEPKFSESFAMSNGNDSGAMYIAIDAIHSGVTKNYINYTAEALTLAVPTWVTPYNKPVLKDHAELSDNIIGRVTEANVVASDNDRVTVKLVAAIVDKEAKERIEDGRYKSVSIGSYVHEARCNICGANPVVDGFCHWPGVAYDTEDSDEEKICVWDVTRVEHSEVSIVASPADSEAMITRIIEMNNENPIIIGGDMKAMTKDKEAVTATESVAKHDSNIEATVDEAAEQQEQVATKEEQQQQQQSAELTKDELMKAVEGLRASELSTVEKIKQFVALKSRAEAAGIELDETPYSFVNKPKEPVISKEEYDKLVAEHNELKVYVTELERVITELEQSVSVTATEYKRIIEENKQLQEAIHESKVWHLVDLKSAVYSSADARNKIFEQYKDKSDEVIEALIEEYQQGKFSNEPPKIDNDTLPMTTTNEADVIEEEAEQDSADNVLTFIDRDTIARAMNGDAEALEKINRYKQKKEE